MDLLHREKTEISLLKDPFKSDCVDRIVFWIDHGKRGSTFESDISFSNGDTKGQQKIQAKSFNELVLKTEQFIKTLDS